MITRKELAERREWSYEQKIDHALYVIDAFIHRNNGKVFMVLDTDAESAVLMDLTWRMEKSICGVYPEDEKAHTEQYGGFPMYPTMAITPALERKYLQRGQCATYEEDGDKRTEAYPLSIWTREEVERYISDHRDLRKFIRKR